MDSFKVYFASFFYLVFISIGVITVVDTGWSPIQLLVGVSCISFIVFLLINYKSAWPLVCLTCRNKQLSFIMATCLFFMFIPIFVCQKKGVSPVFYNLIFSSVLPLISYFSVKQYIKSLILFMFVIMLFVFSQLNLYHLFALVGPASCYFLLRTTKLLSNKEKVTTSQLMFIRYFVLTIICVLIVPFMNLSLIHFNSIDIFQVVVISLFLTILPIYCAQYITVAKDHNYASKVISLLPTSTFIIELLFFRRHVISLYQFVFSIILGLIMFGFLSRRIFKN